MTRGRGKNAPDRSGELMDAAKLEAMLACVQPGLPEKAAQLMRSILLSDSALKVIKPEDMPLLEQYCMAYQVWSDAKDAYLSRPEEGRTRESTAKGYKRNSDIDVMSKASDQMIKIAKQIGLTPVARATLCLTNAASASMMATAFPGRVKAMFEAANGKTD